MQLTEGHVEWTVPAPLWPLNGDPQDAENRRRFRTPAILRFANDSFMDEFLNLLNTDPHRLNEFVAAPETWSSPPNEPAAPVAKSGMALVLTRARQAAVRKLQARGTRVIGELPGPTAGKVLKLYQPAHGRFYLVATCLVCRMLGLPDRRIDAGVQERATFVLRLLQPHANANRQNPDPRDCDEFALVNGAWQIVNDPSTFVAGEEQHPLAPAAYIEDDQRRRRLLVGMIPVGDRERLLQATQPNPAGQPQSTPLDARQMLLKTQVIGPLFNLETLAGLTFSATQKNPDISGSGPDPSKIPDILRHGNDQIQQISWYVLLDLAKYLESNANDLWQVINNQASASTLSPAAQTVLSTLTKTIDMDSTTNLVQALQQAYAASDQLEGVKGKYDSTQPAGWPSLRFQFYKATSFGIQYLHPLLDRPTFEAQVVAALPQKNLNPPLPMRTVAQANANPQAPVWFTVRCVLERPSCGALIPPLVSEPTLAFQLAAYFDPDAPARPIRIGLPVDTTPAGLRKFDKNTAFIMSDTLCGQVSRMSSVTFAQLVLSILPFPLHSDLPSGSDGPCAGGGLVCSFSIPIITICALILLIIFVKLLDIIFFWMPFFQICLPLPNFSAKES